MDYLDPVRQAVLRREKSLAGQPFPARLGVMNASVARPRLLRPMKCIRSSSPLILSVSCTTGASPEPSGRVSGSHLPSVDTLILLPCSRLTLGLPCIEQSIGMPEIGICFNAKQRHEERQC